MYKFAIIAIVVILCINLSASEPTCYNRLCPVGTTNCKKSVRSSPNRRSLEITITCLDDFDGNLKEYFFQEPSVLNPHTRYESSSYSVAGGISDNYYGGNNAVEDFS